MPRHTQLIAASLVVGVLALPLTGCSSDDPASPAENTAAACDAYAEFVGAVAEAQASLNTSSTIGEISTARDKVSQAHDNLVSAVSTVGEDRLDVLTAAWEDYDSAVSGLDQNVTVPAAAQQLRGNVESIVAAQNNLDSSLGC